MWHIKNDSAGEGQQNLSGLDYYIPLHRRNKFTEDEMAGEDKALEREEER